MLLETVYVHPMNEVQIAGTVFMQPKEMVRLVNDPRAAELLVKLDPVAGYGDNIVTVRCYGENADIALTLNDGDQVEITGQLIGQPAHVNATSLRLS